MIRKSTKAGRFGLRSLGAAVVGACFCSTPSFGQVASGTTSPRCVITETAIARADAAPKLMALSVTCGGDPATLGVTAAYDAAYNAELQSLLVVTKGQFRARVLLVSAGPGGKVVVNDVSRELARSSGRSPDQGLDEAKVDISKFSGLGLVSVGKRRDSELSKSGEASKRLLAGLIVEESEVSATLTLTPYANRARVGAK